MWFLRRLSRSNGHLVFELNEQLSTQLRQAARASEQSPETLAAELLTRGLEQEAQRAQVQSTLKTLSPREQEVTWLTARGYTNRQKLLFIIQIDESLIITLYNVFRSYCLCYRSCLFY